MTVSGKPVLRGLVTLGLAAVIASGATAAQSLLDSPLPAAGQSGETTWSIELLPDQTARATEFRRVESGRGAAVRIEANASYGNLVQRLPRVSASALSWRWRVEQFNQRADLRVKSGDDTNVKVCLLFDLPLQRIPFLERQLLQLARAKSGRDLPGATVCYVWDATLAAGTALDNAYSRRVRYLVVRGREANGAGWLDERRDIAADFARLFGDEVGASLPPLTAVAVGADADDTGGRSIAEVADVRLTTGQSGR
jgi:hypothetical protein